MTPQEIISDEEIVRVHGNANFGAMDPREVVNDGVRKTAVGYHCGSTQLHILRDHGLVTKPRSGFSDTDLTKKGKAYARSIYCVTTPARAEARDEGAAGERMDSAFKIASDLHAAYEQLIYGLPRYLEAENLTDEENMVREAYITLDVTAHRLAALSDAHPSAPPAADEDRVRIAVEALELAAIRFDEIYEAAEVDDVAYRNEATIHGINGVADVAQSEVREALVALKSEGK